MNYSLKRPKAGQSLIFSGAMALVLFGALMGQAADMPGTKNSTFLPDSQPPSPTLIRLTGHKSPVVYVGNKPLLPQDFSLPAGVYSAPFANLTLHSDGQVAVEAKRAVDVTVDDLDGWRLRIPETASASISISPDKGRIETRTWMQGSVVMMNLPDGGSLVMNAGSWVSFDGFTDKTYSVAGMGGVQAKSAEGKDIKLDSDLPPMTGGPLLKVMGPNGEQRLKRSTPTVPLTIESHGEGNMQVRVGSELIAVSGAPNQTLNFPNGSSLILNQKSPQDVTWEVSRGDFLIRVGGEAGLAVHSWSRQKANVTWSAANRSVDLQNLSSGPMIASLPNRTDASVSPGAVLQFVRLSEFASAASAAVGDVTLYDRATGKRSNLSRGQSVLKSAQDATDTLGVPPTPVTLAWRSSGGLEITKDGVRTVLHPNEETILIGSDGSELRVRFTGERGAELVTIARAALIKTEKMDGLSLYLPPNTSFSLSARANSGFIEGRAGAGNTVPVRLTGQDGSTMLLDADADVLVLAPLFGLTGAGVEAVYSEALEAAGRSNEKNVPGPRHVTPDSFARDPRGIYRPRITQPPVSVHGHHPR